MTKIEQLRSEGIIHNPYELFELLNLVEMQHEALKEAIEFPIDYTDRATVREAIKSFEEWNKP